VESEGARLFLKHYKCDSFLEHIKMALVRHKESIHSGQFMVSNFEAEDEDVEEDLDISETKVFNENCITAETHGQNQFQSVLSLFKNSEVSQADQLIDNNLAKLFQCMSIVYRQKLTSPKWNRFLGLKLRWKDKIRLNNVIWRCWHMHFIKRQKNLVFSLANPLESGSHNKTEAGAIMMGKYWKRKMDSVLAEYKKWRIFYKNLNNGAECLKYNNTDKTLIKTGQDDIDLQSMITDADFLVDAIFNSLESEPTHFEDDWRTTFFTNSDLIQPGLINLQPNLDDLMDMDPMVTMHDWFSVKQQDPYSVPVRRKSLTPDQDIFNHIMPSQMVPPTNLELLHSSSGNTFMKTTIIDSPILSQKVMNSSGIQANPNFCDESRQVPEIGTQQFHNNGQYNHQQSVIIPNKKIVHHRNEINPRHPIKKPLALFQVTKFKAGVQNNNTKKTFGKDSELAKLLQLDIRDPRLTNPTVKLVQKPIQQQTRLTDLRVTEVLMLDPVVFHPFLLIPPPPPGCLPQPPFSTGSSTSASIPEYKKAACGEKKRKGKLSTGFDMLQLLVPSLLFLPTVKMSKAAQLIKSAEYIQQLKEENEAIRIEVETLRHSVEILNEDLRSSHAQLPSRGSAAVTCEASRLQDMFCKHVDHCTRQNWKYWVFSRIMKPVLESFESTVSSSSPGDFARTSSSWLDQHVTLVQLRPLVTNALKDLSMDSVILADPHQMPIEALNSAASLSFSSNLNKCSK